MTRAQLVDLLSAIHPDLLRMEANLAPYVPGARVNWEAKHLPHEHRHRYIAWQVLVVAEAAGVELEPWVTELHTRYTR